jgi:hypothetical protein
MDGPIPTRAPMSDDRSPIAGIVGKRTESADIDGSVDRPGTHQFAGLFTPFESYDRTTENRGVAGSIPALAVPVAMRDSGRRRRLELAFKRRRKGDEGRGYGGETRSWRIQRKLAPAAQDLQYRRRGTRRRVLVGAWRRRDRLAPSMLMTELAIDQNRTATTPSACTSRSLPPEAGVKDADRPAVSPLK